jgi:hypothetical protein
MRNKGQTSTVEHVIMVLMVVAAIVAMTVYMRRLFQARIYDANNAVAMTAANALGNGVKLEYEPYYYQATTNTDKDAVKQESLTGTGGLFVGTQTTTSSQGTSEQFAPANK